MSRALVLAALVGMALGTPAAAAPRRFETLTPAARQQRWRSDARQLQAFSKHVTRLVVELDASESLWDREKTEVLTADERERALDLFGSVLEFALALDSISTYHFDGFWRVSLARHPVRHAQHFALGFAAYCGKLLLGFVFIEKTLGKPQFEALLDEGSPQRGIAPGAYGKLKWNVVHVEKLGRLFAAHTYHQVLGRSVYARLRKRPLMRFVLEEAGRAYRGVRRYIQLEAPKMFLGNGLDILKDRTHDRWFPVQAGVAEWMGDVRFRDVHASLISAEQIEHVVGRTRAGDILVERRNWYLSNIGLPGFWPHAALWVGTPKELAAHLGADPEVKKAFDGNFIDYLKKHHSSAWEHYSSPNSDGHPNRVIEAVAEGVVFTSAEHSIAADYAAALRPRLSKLELARAVERAFSFHGRPYDFDFDFYTDQELVCSELVYKAYEPRKGVQGLKFDLVRTVGRMTLPPNTIVAGFDRQYDTESRQLDFVWFLDGREKEKLAEWGDVASFRSSHRRPKWDIVQK